MRFLCPDVVSDLAFWRMVAVLGLWALVIALGVVVFAILDAHRLRRRVSPDGFDAMRGAHGDVPRPLPSRRWAVR